MCEARYWRIFELLQADRPVGLGGGIGFIPSSSVITYMVSVEREADAREIDRAIRFVHAIDVEYVTLRHAKDETPKP